MKPEKWHWRPGDASKIEPAINQISGLILKRRRGNMEVRFYAPDRIDVQNPHDQDEVYVVVSGEGRFVNGKDEDKDSHPFSAGDIIFVPAGRTHYFKDFRNLQTWVIFYGPKIRTKEGV